MRRPSRLDGRDDRDAIGERLGVAGRRRARAPAAESDRGRSASRRPARSAAGLSASPARVPMTASGTTGSPASIASRKLPALKRATWPSGLRVPSAKMMQRQPFRDERPPAVQDPGAIGMRAIDEQVPAALQVPAEHGKLRQRFLGDDPQLIRQRRRRAPACRRCSGDSTRRRRSCPASRARGPRRVTRTPVVFRISHDHARAQRCAKYPRRSNRLDTIDAVPSTIV